MPVTMHTIVSTTPLTPSAYVSSALSKLREKNGEGFKKQSVSYTEERARLFVCHACPEGIRTAVLGNESEMNTSTTHTAAAAYQNQRDMFGLNPNLRMAG